MPKFVDQAFIESYSGYLKDHFFNDLGGGGQLVFLL